jgi:aldehyde dehydrogenase (NAD+)/betaine-aldehyde dehydrogenase
LTAVKLGPALAMGNTVVLKASEIAPAPLFEFARLVEEVGFPPGVINVITGFGEPCGRALTSHPDVARVAFTGGPDTAREIVRNTAENFAVTSLELGGKSPILVFADADLESATNGVLTGNFGASGQSCVAGSRLLVERSVRDALLERLVNRAAAIRVGDPLDESTEMGPLATSKQLDKIERVVSASVAAGCTCLTGGAPPEGFARGFYYAPTILDCPGRDFPSVEEELFGPVLSVLTFEDEEQAVELANATRFGLAAGVFTRDLARGHRIVNQLRAGIVWVNTYRAVSPIAPFGGFGQSGYGREAGIESALEYTRTKTVWINTSDAPVPDPFVMR